jgi:hypothetical protein
MGALAITGDSGASGVVRRAGGGVVGPTEPSWFEIEVVTTGPGQTYSWNASAGTSVSSTTDWGDGSTIIQTGIGIRQRTYAAAGTYVVRIQASFGSGGGFEMRPNVDRTRLARILGPIPGFSGLTTLANFVSGCSGLTGTIPADLLKYVPNVTTLQNFFANCSGLTGTIPADLLRYAVSVTTLQGFLLNCSGLTGTIPIDFLRYLVNATNYNGFVSGCTNLQLQQDLFGPSPVTFFSTRTPNFTSAFRNVGTFAGTPQGTAPPLWTYTYAATPVRTTCFALNSATNLSNWAQIPIAWGGPA